MTSKIDGKSEASLLAVLVLYKQTPAQSDAYQTLMTILERRPDLAEGIELLVYDNSPAPAPFPPMAATSTRYYSDPSNGGLAVAYNTGLQLAREHGFDWLLLLDQDTLLTTAYVTELRETTSRVSRDQPSVAAIVPKLVYTVEGETLVHSPHYVPWLSHRSVDLAAYGVPPREVSAYNSGAAIRVSALVLSGGFPSSFPMEFLDHATFRMLQACGGVVWIMQSGLHHSLSTMNLGKDVPLARYKQILCAERDFYRQMGSMADRCWYRLRRVKQAIGHAVKVADKRYATLDVRAAFGLLGS